MPAIAIATLQRLRAFRRGAASRMSISNTEGRPLPGRVEGSVLGAMTDVFRVPSRFIPREFIAAPSSRGVGLLIL
jgi:hypothetical protein